MRLGLLLGVSAFGSVAHAQCVPDTSPANNGLVSCTGASVTPVNAPASTGVNVTIAAGASLVPPITVPDLDATPAIRLGAGARVSVDAGALLGNAGMGANSHALLLGPGAEVSIAGTVEGAGGLTGPTQNDGNIGGLSNSLVRLLNGGLIRTTGAGSYRAINGFGGGNRYLIDGEIRATGISGSGILPGVGDELILGATGRIITQAGDSASPVNGPSSANVRVTTAAGSRIELAGIGTGITLGTGADVTIAGHIVSTGAAASSNSSGGVGIRVGAGSTVTLAATGQILTGNTLGQGNQGTGGIGIATAVSGAPSLSTIRVDGLIDAQRAQGISMGLDTLTIGSTGQVTTRLNNRSIFANLFTSTTSFVTTITIEGVVEQLGTGAALFLQASRATGETVETSAIANVTIAPGARLSAAANLAYGQLDGAGSFPDVIDNLVVAGTVTRGNAGTVINLDDGADRITVLPTASIIGTINGGNATGGATQIDVFAVQAGAGQSGTFDFGVAPLVNFEAGEKLGAGQWRLVGNLGNGINGTFSVLEGRLVADAAMPAAGASVADGARLAGSGSLGGLLSVAGGGVLEGVAGQVLSLGAASFSDLSRIEVALGAPSETALFNVAGALTLDGRLFVSDAGGFGEGLYRLFDHGGALTNNGLVIAGLPMGFNPGAWEIDTGTDGQVNLRVAPVIVPAAQYWDGANTMPGLVETGRGGSGQWTMAGTNWTNVQGSINAAFAGQQAVFGGDGSPAVVTLAGAQLATDLLFLAGTDYRLTGDALTLTGGGVETGAAAMARLDLAVETPLLAKRGVGTLAIGAALDAPVRVEAGELRVTQGGTLGGDAEVLAGAVLGFAPEGTMAYDGALSGAGTLRQLGSGTLALGGASAGFAGQTEVLDGRLQVTGELAAMSWRRPGRRLPGVAGSVVM
jgi:hypothetical protein